MLIPLSAYVQQADGSTVQVVVLDAGVHEALQALGFEGVLPTLVLKWATTSAKPGCSPHCVISV